MPGTDIILLHAPHVYDFRKIPQLYGPVSDLVPSTPVFEMYPVGFTSIAEYLERYGYRVRIVNIAWRMLRDARFDAEKFIARLKAPVFGIDLHWMVHAHGSIEIARLVKKHHPASKVIIGGFSASRFYKEVISYPEVDYVMRGDSTEEPMRLFMDNLTAKTFQTVPNLAWKDEAGAVHENPLSYVPDDISHVMGNHYGFMVRQVLRYRDLASVVPFKGWLKYPVTAVFTGRGCRRNCVFCGGSAKAMKTTVERCRMVFRTAEDIFKDIRNISQISRGTISILGDIRDTGDENALRLLQYLQQDPINNSLMFEIYDPVPEKLMSQIAQAAPGFVINMSPHSHDFDVRKATGINYSNAEMENTVDNALKLGAGKVELFFMIGLPEQDENSVMDTVEYCRHLLEKFNGDKRLSLYIGPLGPFLDPGSEAYENPEKHGYRLLIDTFERHRQALTMPSWKHTLNYETLWLSRDAIMDVTYRAISRLTGYKADYGQIPRQMANRQIERIKQAVTIERRIDEILEQGNPDGINSLKTEMDAVNSGYTVEQWQMLGRGGLFGLKYFSSLWSVIKERS
ncbi:MAG: TIGR04190 family B12-binding domain/radical SAM domain protein [Dehalococcoidaceae bacterium]|nr:TIGR04190 family B12-binding domain/radical SAM domain protein [Dehalococcoidaceae bacterium]